MSFIPKLEVREETITPFGHMRIMDSLSFRDGSIRLSIQGSDGMYCTPRKTLPFEEYTHLEMAVVTDDGEKNAFVTVGDVIDDPILAGRFHDYYDGEIYTYVPVALIERLYQELSHS